MIPPLPTDPDHMDIEEPTAEPHHDPRPCCQTFHITFTCGHNDNKYVKFSETGERVRVGEAFVMSACRGAHSDGENPQSERAAIEDLYCTNCADYVETVTPKFVSDHQHPSCGLFSETYTKVNRPCPSCLRRLDRHGSKTRPIVAQLRRQLEHARRHRWKRSDVDKIQKQLEEEEDWVYVEEELMKVFYPLVECENCLRNDMERVSRT